MKHQLFIEKFLFTARGGKGGNGNQKFGSAGGKGGDVILESIDNYSLNEVKYKLGYEKPCGSPGINAVPSDLIGKKGETKIIKLPINTVVYNSMDVKLGEFTKQGEQLVVAHGGCGGNAKNNFLGEPGMVQYIRVVMKILADIGLVGFPNAGKSTLLTAMSKAKPMIAPYAFTTMQPQIGHISFDDNRLLSIADLPGLIEGAWNDEGLGHEFLRHVERTKVLLYVIDINGFQLSPSSKHRSAFECIMLLNKEMEIYNPSLLFKPSILAINKMDQAGSHKKLEKLVDQLKNREEIYNSYPKKECPQIKVRFKHMVPVSAKFRYDVNDLKEVIRNNIDDSFKEIQRSKLKTAQKQLNKILKVKLKDLNI